MPIVEAAQLFVTQSGEDAIEFKVVYGVRFSDAEIGHTFTESFTLHERDTTSADDVIATDLARAEFVADAQSPFTPVARTLTARLSERRVNTEIGNEEIYARVRVSAAAFGSSTRHTNEVQVAA
jgi:hypothetical protein